jgi:hypothetical protein
MAKKDQKKASNYQFTLRDALISFDLKAFKKWMQKYNKPLWKSFKDMNEEVQMGAMCKMICNRTDLLSTETHQKAVAWLKEHNMKGRIM